MKYINICILSFLSLILLGCMTGQPVDVPKVGLVFKEGEKVSLDGTTSYGDLPDGLGYSYRVEGGEGSFSIGTPNRPLQGLEKYHQYLLMTDSFNKGCVVNKLNDKRECHISVEGFFIRERNNKPYSLCVSGHDYPGAIAYVRLDGGKTLNLGESGCTSSSQIINAALNAKKVVVQRGWWPYATNKVEEYEVVGHQYFKEMNAFFEKQFN